MKDNLVSEYMINITKHAKDRYVERIKGVADKNERNTYLTLNDEKIIRDITIMLKYSALIFKGKVGAENTAKSFYIHQDIALVLSEPNQNLVTIYRINFAFPEDAKGYVIKSLVEHIQQCGERIENKKETRKSKTEQRSHEKEQANMQIKALEQQIRNLKLKKEILESEDKLELQEISAIHIEQQMYAQQLFGNTDYKKDINEIK